MEFDHSTDTISPDDQTLITIGGALGLAAKVLNLDTTVANPAFVEGRVFYDNVEKAISYYNEVAGITLNLGREELIRVRNVSGTSIANGKVVYINGANSNLPTVALAQANAISTGLAVGVVTADIANNANGYVTYFGIVHNMDTSAFTAGATLYVSAASPGLLTATKPSAPNLAIPIAFCLVSSASVGQLAIIPAQNINGGFVNPMTSTGDIIYGGASGVATRLGIGSESKVMTVVGGVPAWATSTGGGSTLVIDTVTPTAASGGRWLNPDTGVESIAVPISGGWTWFAPTGSRGATGPQGDAGAAGAAGAAGTPGTNGTNPTIGGSDNSIQYNSSGVLAGAANALIENDTMRLNSVNPSASPATDGINIFSRKVGGRNMLAQVGPSGLDTAMQPSLARNKVSRWAAAGNGTVIVADGNAALTATGAATGANVATTNRHTWMKRLEYLVTTAATTAVAGFRAPALQWGRGNTSGSGGFHFVCQWGPATGVANTTHRCFVGMQSSTAAPTDVEPSTLTNMFGFGWNAADTNIQFMNNDASGAATKTDLGSSFPVPTVDRTKVYDIALFCAPNGTEIFYEINDLATGAQNTGSVTTDIPANTLLLAPRGWVSVGGASSVVGIALMNLYIETDY